MGSNYSYNPLGDSLLGELICKVWVKRGGNAEQLTQAIYSFLKEGMDFKGTPRGEKQLLMNILPNRIRKYKEQNNFVSIQNELKNLLMGRELVSKPTPDVAFELLEWILTGFQDDKLVLELLPVVFNDKVKFDSEFLNELKNSYNELLNEV